MHIVRDLCGIDAPVPIEVYYNGDVDSDSTTKRYKGSLVKTMDHDDADHGRFFCWAGSATAMENVAGILAEDQDTTGNYLPDDATYGMKTRKMYPLLPTSIVRAEYVQTDAAGTDSTDTGATGTAASSDLTITTENDRLIGGWIYFVNGLNAGYLHYVTNTTSTTSITLATALNYDVASADNFLVIEPPTARLFDFTATFDNILSEANGVSYAVCGIMHYVQARNMNMQRLDRNKHDGLKLDGAKFFHDFTIPVKNFWTAGTATS